MMGFVPWLAALMGPVTHFDPGWRRQHMVVATKDRRLIKAARKANVQRLIAQK